MAGHRMAAPPSLVPRVMAAIADERPGGAWARPFLGWCGGRSLALAASAALLLFGGVLAVRTLPAGRVEVVFQLHAPAAHSVELVGSFTGWEAGVLQLEGPDATGHWTAKVRLPAGRHEYSFLVDGKEWVADPRAVITRPDGFGRRNAVMEI
jgi:hypothetical protein